MGASSVTGIGQGSAEGPIRGLGPIHKALQEDMVGAAATIEDEDVILRDQGCSTSELCDVNIAGVDEGVEIGLVEGTEVDLAEGAQVQPLDENEEVFKATDMNMRQIELLEQLLAQMQIMNTHLECITGETITLMR